MRVLCTTVRVLWLLFDLKRYVASFFSVFSKSNFGRGRYPDRSFGHRRGRKDCHGLGLCLQRPLLNRTSSPPLHALLPPPAGPPRGSAGARGAHTLVCGACTQRLRAARCSFVRSTPGTAGCFCMLQSKTAIRVVEWASASKWRGSASGLLDCLPLGPRSNWTLRFRT